MSSFFSHIIKAICFGKGSQSVSRWISWDCWERAARTRSFLREWAWHRPWQSHLRLLSSERKTKARITHGNKVITDQLGLLVYVGVDVSGNSMSFKWRDSFRLQQRTGWFMRLQMSIIYLQYVCTSLNLLLIKYSTFNNRNAVYSLFHLNDLAFLMMACYHWQTCHLFIFIHPYTDQYFIYPIYTKAESKQHFFLSLLRTFIFKLTYFNGGKDIATLFMIRQFSNTEH